MRIRNVHEVAAALSRTDRLVAKMMVARADADERKRARAKAVASVVMGADGYRAYDEDDDDEDTPADDDPDNDDDEEVAVKPKPAKSKTKPKAKRKKPSTPTNDKPGKRKGKTKALATYRLAPEQPQDTAKSTSYLAAVTGHTSQEQASRAHTRTIKRAVRSEAAPAAAEFTPRSIADQQDAGASPRAMLRRAERERDAAKAAAIGTPGFAPSIAAPSLWGGR